jgi:ATP-dependent exoDNAse (exonuclease V) beta subunit
MEQQLRQLINALKIKVDRLIACDDEVISLKTRIDEISDEADLEKVHDAGRHLLYVACTRAGDQLLTAGVNPASEFLDDLA